MYLYFNCEAEISNVSEDFGIYVWKLIHKSFFVVLFCFGIYSSPDRVCQEWVALQYYQWINKKNLI